MMRIDSSY